MPDQICTRCEGTGSVGFGTGAEDCPSCSGHGTIYVPPSDDPRGHWSGYDPIEDWNSP